MLSRPVAAPAGASDRGRHRVLIVDDSVVARAVIARAVEAGGRNILAGSVSSAAAALTFLRSNVVDVILLDIQMPEIDGLTALPELLSAGGGAKVLIISAVAGKGADAAIRALALGAADTLAKPEPGDLAGRFSRELAERIERLCDRSPATRYPATPTGTIARRRPLSQGFDLVAIGASTGGIHALHLLLHELPARCSIPILVTQHLPHSFMPYFAAQLAALSGRPCSVAQNSMRIRPGEIIVAPGHAHLRCVSTGDGAAVRLSAAASVSGCTPSVDPMLDSAAEVFGARLLAVVLTGMGRDGCLGAQKVAERGGTIVVQDQPSSVVWGMPGAIAAAGIADAVLPPDAIGRLIAAARRPS